MPSVLPEDSPLRVYYAHGVHLTNGSSRQMVAECPFCKKEEKFYVDRDTGLYHCFVCQEKGNPLEFLRKLHEHCFETTTEDQYKELARERKYLNIATLMEWEFAYNELKGEWIVPGYFSSGDNSDKLKQLYHWSSYKTKDGKNHLQATPGFPQCVYGINHFDKSKTDVYITEGPWDALALIEVLQCTKVDVDGTYEFTGNVDASLYSNVNVIALPSASIFPIEWLSSFLSGRRVYLLLDNDHPKNIGVNGNTRMDDGAGWKGYQSIIRKIVDNHTKPTEMYFLHWGKGYKEDSYNPHLKSGYDVRDLLGENYKHLVSDCQKKDEKISLIEQRIKNLESLYAYVESVRDKKDKWTDPTSKGGDRQSKRGNVKDISLKMTPCESWTELLNAWKEAMVWHDGLEKALTAMLSCVMSTMIPGTQLWLRVVGPPSCGKSVLCDALCVNRNYVTMQSNIRGFFSGMRPTKKDAKEGRTDLGLIEEIMGKTFVTKDGDTIIQAPDRQRILAEARDLYDGSTKTHFRTGMGREYSNIRTTWILCGTFTIKEIGDNELGERFIDCEVIREIDSTLEEQIGMSAIRNMRSLMKRKVNPENVESMDGEKRLIAKKMTGGYIEYLCTKSEQKFNQIMDKENLQADRYIYRLGKFVSFMRARPGKQDEYVKRELSARLSEQLFRLAGCMAVVMGYDEINEKVLRRVSEIAYDTSQGSVFTIIRHLYLTPKGATYGKLGSILDRKENDLQELLRFLRRLKALDFSGDGFHSRNGYGDSKYTLSQELRTICQDVFTYMEHIL